MGAFLRAKQHRAVSLDIVILDETLKKRQFCTFFIFLKCLASLTCLREKL